MIQLDDVHKRFTCGQTLERLFDPLEVKALRGLSVEHPSGVCLHVTGPPAAGKSVLLNLLIGMYEPDRGRVRIFGKDPTRSMALRHNLGFVRPGARTFDPVLSPTMNLRVCASMYDLSPSLQRQRVREALEFVGIEKPQTGLPYGELSPRTQSLLALAAGLISSPECVMLDEPARHLDQGGVDRMNRMLTGLQGNGVTLVVATRQPELVDGLERREIHVVDGQKERYRAPG